MPPPFGPHNSPPDKDLCGRNASLGPTRPLTRTVHLLAYSPRGALSAGAHLGCLPRGYTFKLLVPPGKGFPHGHTPLLPQGKAFRTVHLACSPRGELSTRHTLKAFRAGTPCLFPQGKALRTGTPPRSPRGRLSALFPYGGFSRAGPPCLFLPGEGCPQGHTLKAFRAGTPSSCLFPQGKAFRTGTPPIPPGEGERLSARACSRTEFQIVSSQALHAAPLQTR